MHLLEQRDQAYADLKRVKWLRVEWDNMHKQNGYMSTAKVKPVSLLSASKLPIKADDRIASCQSYEAAWRSLTQLRVCGNTL